MIFYQCCAAIKIGVYIWNANALKKELKKRKEEAANTPARHACDISIETNSLSVQTSSSSRARALAGLIDGHEKGMRTHANHKMGPSASLTSCQHACKETTPGSSAHQPPKIHRKPSRREYKQDAAKFKQQVDDRLITKQQFRALKRSGSAVYKAASTAHSLQQSFHKWRFRSKPEMRLLSTVCREVLARRPQSSDDESCASDSNLSTVGRIGLGDTNDLEHKSNSTTPIVLV